MLNREVVKLKRKKFLFEKKAQKTFQEEFAHHMNKTTPPCPPVPRNQIFQRTSTGLQSCRPTKFLDFKFSTVSYHPINARVFYP